MTANEHRASSLRAHRVVQSLYEVMNIFLVDLHHTGFESIVPSASLNLLRSQLKARPESVLDHRACFLRTRYPNHEIRRRALCHYDERPRLVAGPSSVFPVYVDEECGQFSQGHWLREESLVSFGAPYEGVPEVFEQSQASLFHHGHCLLDNGSLEGHAQRKSLLKERKTLPRQRIVGSVETIDPSLLIVFRIGRVARESLSRQCTGN